MEVFNVIFFRKNEHGDLQFTIYANIYFFIKNKQNYSNCL